MRGWLARGLLICGTFMLAWVAAIAYWRGTNRMPDAGELGLYLFAAPALVLAAIWLGVKLVNSRKQAAQTPATDSGEKIAVEQNATPIPPASLAILASALRTAHGDSAAELLANMRANKASFELDPELTNVNGYPILSARAGAAEDDTTLEAFAAWVANQGKPAQQLLPEQARAICLGTAVAKELGQYACLHPALPVEQGRDRETGLAQPALPTLELLALLPSDWDPVTKGLAANWFSHLLQQEGWPQDKIRLAMPPAGPGQTMAGLRLVMQDQAQADQPRLLLLLASASYLGEQTIDQWERSGVLTGSQGKLEQIPGEGAAALLLADARQARELWDAPTLLHAIAQGKLEKPAETGQANTAILSSAVTEALQLAQAQPQEISMLCADSGHRSNRASEMISVGQQHFPELEPNSDYLRTTSACGEMGAASELAALALAHHEASTTQEKILCASNQDSYWRYAAVIGGKPITATPTVQDTNSKTRKTSNTAAQT